MPLKLPVTREQFAAYERVRKSGLVNTLSTQVQALAGITVATHWAILDQYADLAAQWPDVREGE